jgi:hypothetical protein
VLNNHFLSMASFSILLLPANVPSKGFFRLVEGKSGVFEPRQARSKNNHLNEFFA